MYFYVVAVLVLLISKNAAETGESATTAASEPGQASFDKGELAKLIHHVVEAENQGAEDADHGHDERKVPQLHGPAMPLDLNYFDIRLDGALKSRDVDIMNLVKKNLFANEAHAANSGNNDYAIRIHLIKNPEVLDQYRKNLMKKHLSTSSSSGYDDSLEYDRNVESFIRRNAVFRLGKPSDQANLRENPKFALRNGEEVEMEKHEKNSREDTKALHFGRNDYRNDREKIIVSFKETKHEDYNDKPRQSENKPLRSKNNYNEGPKDKDMWDDIAKNAYKWNEKKDNGANKKEKYNEDYKKDNFKNTDDYKKKDGYDNYKKEKYDDYDSWNSKLSKPKESKLNDWDKKMDWDKPKKDNSWDNWKSNSMEQAKHKRGSNGGSKPKRNEDWDKPKRTDDWDKPKKTDDWDKPKRSDNWDTHKKRDDWDTPKRSENWDKPKKRDDWDTPKRSDNWDKPKKSDDWDTPRKIDEWDKPKKSNDWDKSEKNNNWDKPKNDDNWDKPKKATKGIASFETEPKKEYFDKEDIKEKKKKTTNEWDRAVAYSGGGSGAANKRPFVPKISDYYNPRPRIHENPAVPGFKSFGRTSIPFVGKKGIYEEK